MIGAADAITNCTPTASTYWTATAAIQSIIMSPQAVQLLQSLLWLALPFLTMGRPSFLSLLCLLAVGTTAQDVGPLAFNPAPEFLCRTYITTSLTTDCDCASTTSASTGTLFASALSSLSRASTPASGASATASSPLSVSTISAPTSQGPTIILSSGSSSPSASIISVPTSHGSISILPSGGFAPTLLSRSRSLSASTISVPTSRGFPPILRPRSSSLCVEHFRPHQPRIRCNTACRKHQSALVGHSFFHAPELYHPSSTGFHLRPYRFASRQHLHHLS